MSIHSVVEKTPSVATYGGAGSAVVFGLSANELAAFIGAAVAVLGLIIQTALSIYFKQRHLKVVEAAAKTRPDCATCPEREV